MQSSASSALLSFGAKPPSSPTAVLKPFCFEHALERVKRFRDRAQAFAERRQAVRLDHEFLEINRRIGVRAAVDDVGHRHGQNFGVGSAEIFEQRLAERGGGGFGVRERDGEDGVGAELGLGFRAVELEHRGVHGELVERVHADERGLDFGVGVGDGFLHAFAAETLFVAVAEFDGFVFAGAGAAGDGGASDRAACERHINFHGGVTARVEDFARLYVLNFCHN